MVFPGLQQTSSTHTDVQWAERKGVRQRRRQASDKNKETKTNKNKPKDKKTLNTVKTQVNSKSPVANITLYDCHRLNCRQSGGRKGVHGKEHQETGAKYRVGAGRNRVSCWGFEKLNCIAEKMAHVHSESCKTTSSVGEWPQSSECRGTTECGTLKKKKKKKVRGKKSCESED